MLLNRAADFLAENEIVDRRLQVDLRRGGLDQVVDELFVGIRAVQVQLKKVY